MLYRNETSSAFVVLLIGQSVGEYFRDVKQAHKRRAIVYEYERLEQLKRNKNCRVCRCLVGF
jgi:hypothetical protein